MRGLLRTLTLSQRPRPPVGKTPADVVHRENKWRLLRYRAPRAPDGSESTTRRFRTPVVLVPSLINRHYVLDLLPGKSFAEWMVARGHDVYCIDWGTPEDEDRYVELDDIADRYLGRAFRVAARVSGAERPHVLGYCLGGTLTALHAAAHPDSMASLTLLAAPIGFHDGGLLSTWVRSRAFDVDALVQATGNVPWPLMQAAFHMLRPTMTAAKVVGLLDRAWEDEFLDSFHAVETWGNDNVSFPGACYRRYIQELYRDDALVNGTFSLSGRPARLESIAAPLLAVTFQHDNIVPEASAAVIMDRVGSVDKHRIHLAGGHVGAVISKKAASGLWPAISTFWADRDGAPAAVAAAPAEIGEAPAKAAEAPAKAAEAPAKAAEAPAKVTEAPAKVAEAPAKAAPARKASAPRPAGGKRRR